MQQMKRQRIEPVLRRGAPAPGDEDWRPWLDPVEPEPEPEPERRSARSAHRPAAAIDPDFDPAEVPEAPMAETRGARRDPAPSRAAYRLHRLWLTPFYRALLRKGLPTFAVIFCAGLWLSDDARLTAIGRWVDGAARLDHRAARISGHADARRGRLGRDRAGGAAGDGADAAAVVLRSRSGALHDEVDRAGRRGRGEADGAQGRGAGGAGDRAGAGGGLALGDRDRHARCRRAIRWRRCCRGWNGPTCR